MSNESNLAIKLVERYIKIARNQFGDRLLAAAVFGSLARGVAKFPESDIDILLILEGIDDLSFGKRIDLLKNIYIELRGTEEYQKFKEAFIYSPSIQEYILTPEELKKHPPLLLDLTVEVIILHDSGILNEELEKLRSRLRELGARRIETGDSWFWILKPDLRLGEELEL
ncbi:MAG: nucleotidyltransferase domain-containing protein [Methanocellales archaeon]